MFVVSFGVCVYWVRHHILNETFLLPHWIEYTIFNCMFDGWWNAYFVDVIDADVPSLDRFQKDGVGFTHFHVIGRHFHTIVTDERAIAVNG